MTLAEFRAERGLTVTELAALLGKPVSTVHSWVTGARRPDWSSVARIEEVTGGAVTASEFVPRKKPELA
ncbi:helix-turn-helix transcriptional regulator [Roseomonas aerophila]|uniref:Helix-turn-helix transcriptional regulator n=1 Tax=Teichococcus aerophilus TaxID=1224513 RepID=A0ABR7RRL7_9PROT|nr:helix-turn-helix transcriptional regulator [Pseudoroseomonas aerophila]